jgi:hypothetical protein
MDGHVPGRLKRRQYSGVIEWLMFGASLATILAIVARV